MPPQPKNAAIVSPHRRVLHLPCNSLRALGQHMIHQLLTVLWMQSGPGGDFLAAAMAAHAITTRTELADADAWAQDSAAHGFLPLLSGGSICRHQIGRAHV